ncbi:hypothetical protein [Kitasatospora sp. NPDC001683]
MPAQHGPVAHPARRQRQRLTPVRPDLAVTGLTRPLELAVLAHQEQLAELRTAFTAAEQAYRDVMRQAQLPIRLLAGEEISPALEKAIASRLGMSTRTVSSHVQKASELLGSRSRGHLGYIIAREGVRDEPLDEP